MTKRVSGVKISIESLNGCYIGPGRKKYDRIALFRAQALKKLIGLPTTKSLVRCLFYPPLLKDNPRMFCTPHRGRRAWFEFYSHRTSIERLFSVLKGHLSMDRLTKRGIDKAFTDIMICLITYLTGTLVQLKTSSLANVA